MFSRKADFNISKNSRTQKPIDNCTFDFEDSCFHKKSLSQIERIVFVVTLEAEMTREKNGSYT